MGAYAMKIIRFARTYKPLATLVAAATLWMLSAASPVVAQTPRTSARADTIPAGTSITVRTDEAIDSRYDDGRNYTGIVDTDVLGRDGGIVIPKGSGVEMTVKQISDNEVALDLSSIDVNGIRYGVEAQSQLTNSDEERGIGVNKRTGQYVGGGALIGAIIGAIAGGGKGAAIGAGVGAAAGVGAQVLTRGKSVDIPAESLLTFNLTEPLQAGFAADRDGRDGSYSHQSQRTDLYNAAYRDGFRVGRADAERGMARNVQTRWWSSDQDRRDYEIGYDRGYRSVRTTVRQKPDDMANILVGSDNNVSWWGPINSSVYVQVDNRLPQLFASGASGVQSAPWINAGHLYVFVLRDASGREIARYRKDLR
jgi:hypothetical protein